MRLVVASALWLLAGGCNSVFDGELGLVACRQEGAFGPPACPARHTCQDGVCARIGNPLGHGCTADGECRTGSFCLDPAQPAGPALGSKARCSRPCCDSTDCGPYQDGQVCWQLGSGTGAFCWPAGELEQRSSPGPKLTGQACSAGEECRSSLCVDDVCVDNCCSDTRCSHADQAMSCRIRTVSELSSNPGFACGESQAAGSNMPCEADHECASNLCVEVVTGTRICAQPCCSSSECGVMFTKEKVQRLACVPVLDGTQRACALPLPDSANGAVGASCSKNLDCRSALCVADGGESYCSDFCCDDTSCGSTFACLPRPKSSSWALRCVPK